MASSSLINGAAERAPEIIRSSEFRKIFKELGKKGIKNLNDNSPLIKDASDKICGLFGVVPIAGACIFVLDFIVKSAVDFIENKEKLEGIKQYAEFLQVSMNKIQNAGGDNQYLNNCLAMLCKEAVEIEKDSRKQSCVCRFFAAQQEAKWLDGLATNLQGMNEKLNLLFGDVILGRVVDVQNQIPVVVEHIAAIQNQIPGLSEAPLGDSSLKIPNKEELVEFVSKPGVRVLSVWGMGGKGKTTLLKALYDDFPKPVHKAFVEVGQDPTSLTEIQTKIL